jgi:hypothetical protein
MGNGKKRTNGTYNTSQGGIKSIVSIIANALLILLGCVVEILQIILPQKKTARPAK